MLSSSLSLILKTYLLPIGVLPGGKVYWKSLRFVVIDLVLVDYLGGGRGGGGGVGEGVELCGSSALLIGDGEVVGVWIGEFEDVLGEEGVRIGDAEMSGVV
ncbi:hypothetical protein Tco_0958292 [Tanacetum coccineum]